MKIRVLSDVHLEFHQDGGQTFVSEQNDSGYDVLVLAGDVTTSSHLRSVMKMFRDAAGSRPIIYVPGNHEYYDSSPEDFNKILAICMAENTNLRVLDDSFVTIDGQRFIGSTLWFEHSGLHEHGDDNLGDFNKIRGFRDWVGQKAKKSARFLDENLMEGDVVITHHLPSFDSVHREYRGSPMNKYFVHDVSLLVSAGAKIWIHGHTHKSMDYWAHKTRVVCNPFGYLRYEENSSFNEKLTLEV
jgi:predicted phosphodiesterase